MILNEVKGTCKTPSEGELLRNENTKLLRVITICNMNFNHINIYRVIANPKIIRNATICSIMRKIQLSGRTSRRPEIMYKTELMMRYEQNTTSITHQ